MGLDRFTNFITRSLNNECIEEVTISDGNNMRQVVASHVVFDLNFLIYQEIILIENEVNDIIKTILCLPFSTDKGDILEALLKHIFNQEHWKTYSIKKELEQLFDGFNEDEIVQKFISYITIKRADNNNLSIIELVIYEKIINTIIFNLHKIHYIQFIQSILIFYDGIPSISKVIEQRRRRIKNFLESNQKKILFKKYFDKLSTNNKKLFDNLSKKYINIDTTNDNILFDYFKWIKNRFSIDKSIGPASDFIKNLEVFMKTKIKTKFPKINLYINSANENGESDFKIFKYISETCSCGDFSIHTTDSDLIHMILVQQTYYKITDKDINLSVIKYNKSSTVQIIDANHIIKNILESYNSLNNIKTINYKIIWDICLIFYFFGNDHLPSSNEIGPELNLDFFLKKHYIALGKNNIVNLNKTNITLDINCLLLLLEKINDTKKNNITKIILQRYFKINIQLVNIFVDKLNFDFNELLDFLKRFIIFRSCTMDINEYDKLHDDDIRKIFRKSIDINIEKYNSINYLELNEMKNKIVLDNIVLIENNLDYYAIEYNGLIQYNKTLFVTDDPYQDLYNYISDTSTTILTKKYPYLYDYIDISYHLKLNTNNTYDSNICNDYLKKMFHLILIQFGCMKDYHSDNITFYKYNHMPSLDNMIQFIKTIPKNINIIEVWNEEIKYDNIEPNKYLNHINHHLLITPFITSFNINDETKLILSKIQSDIIDNMWLDEDNIEYRNLDIRKYLSLFN